MLAIPKSEADLQWLARALTATKLPFFILGAGSNLLVADTGFSGLIIKTTGLPKTVESPKLATQNGDQVLIRAGAAVAVSSFLQKAATSGWGGAELLAGIPGTLGGAVKMNAGTHLGETKDILVSVDTMSLPDCTFRIFEKESLSFSYRKNNFLPPGAIVLSTLWALKREEPKTIKANIDSIITRRKASQPLNAPSCGSVFKNPPGHSAWQIIDKLGLREYSIGNAQFAKKHGNFILNLGNAKASDVRALIDLAISRAQNELGITLETEVLLLGF